MKSEVRLVLFGAGSPYLSSRVTRFLEDSNQVSVLAPCGALNEQLVALTSKYGFDLITPFLPVCRADMDILWQIIWEPNPCTEDKDLMTLITAVEKGHLNKGATLIRRLFFSYTPPSQSLKDYLGTTRFILAAYPADTLWLEIDRLYCLGMPASAAAMITLSDNSNRLEVVSDQQYCCIERNPSVFDES